VGRGALADGVAGLAIGQGRVAAEAAHARLTGAPVRPAPPRSAVSPQMVKPDFFAALNRVAPPRLPAGGWLSAPEAEMQGTIAVQEFLDEVSRCFSCGSHGCPVLHVCNAEELVLAQHLALTRVSTRAPADPQSDECPPCAAPRLGLTVACVSALRLPVRCSS
jgi:hypothetical protein